MNSTVRVYVTLPDGSAGEVTISVIEEPMPTPQEACTIREPGVHEFRQIAAILQAGKFAAEPPFPILRPTRPKPFHEQ